MLHITPDRAHKLTLPVKLLLYIDPCKNISGRSELKINYHGASTLEKRKRLMNSKMTMKIVSLNYCRSKLRFNSTFSREKNPEA